MTIIASTAAAACICAVVVGSRMNADNLGEPLAELAKCAEARDGVGRKTLLVMPGMNGIEIDEQDADIIWSDNGTVSVNTISINQPSDEGFSKIIVPKGKRARLTLADGTHFLRSPDARGVSPKIIEKYMWREKSIWTYSTMRARRSPCRAGISV